jgi:hypothetical protein
MPHLSWIIPCVGSSVDRFNNAVTLFSVIEEMVIAGDTPEPGPNAKPLPAQGFVVVSHWIREDKSRPEKATARLSIIGPRSRKPLGRAQFDVDLSSHQRARQLSHLPIFPYVGTGDYYIEVQVQKAQKWRTLERIWIDVKKQQGKEAQPTAVVA